MASTIIKINGMGQSAQPRILFEVNDEKDTLADARMQEFQCGLAQPSIRALLDMQSDPETETQAVIEAGMALYSSLGRHQNANQALARTLDAPAASATRKIMFYIRNGVVPEAHNIPWEALRHPEKGFFALEGRVPFVRVIGKDPSRPPRPILGMHLRILALIAAKGIPGRNEWLALKKAFDSWPRALTARIFVYEDALLQEINQQHPNIKAELVPSQFAELATKIESFQPHICHFFCHGHSQNGGYLELANRQTLNGGQPLSVSTGALLGPLQSAWLVILNACSGAQVDLESNSTSIASGLAQDGVPVVVGMREQISVNVVAAFTGAFLSSALRYLARTLRNDKAVDVDFSQALVDGRDAMCAYFGKPIDMAKRTKEWTLPVMYVNACSLLVTAMTDRVASAEEFTRLAAERAKLKQAVRDIGEQLPPGALTEIARRIAELDALIGTAIA